MMFRAWLLLLLMACTNAWAHKASTSYLQLQMDGAAISGRWDVALRDLDIAMGLDTNDDGKLAWGEVRQQQDRIGRYALTRLVLRTERAPCALQLVRMELADHSDGTYASLALVGQCPQAPVDLAIDYQLLFDVDAWHRGLLTLELAGNHAGLFSPEQRTQHFFAGNTSAGDVFMRYLRSGIWHVRTGWDHILFLAGLFLPVVLRRQGRQWHAAVDLRETLVDSAVMVTAFTLAHALTLSLAAYGGFALPARWIESGVAASVLFAGLNNLIPMVHRRLAWLAAGFGLIHGAAMAGALIELGLPAHARVWALLAFNLGVELAQLVVLLAVVPISFAFRHNPVYRRLVLLPGSALIAVIGLWWLVQRAGNIDLGFPAF
ncbi:MAG TPA: HupE/UreJ family protein [Burkholderiaceae bacterium]|nr:HupE/UreJ family protein [Burkholderiaceae bacterium]